MKAHHQSTTSQSKRIRHDARDARTSHAAFPRTDYCFQATTEDRSLIARRPADRAELRAFRQMGDEYLGEKTHRGYAVDFVVYGLLTVLCIWSLVALGKLVLEAMFS